MTDMTGNCIPTFLRFFINGRNLLRYFKQRYHDVFANVMDTLIEGLKIGKEKVILISYQILKLKNKLNLYRQQQAEWDKNELASKDCY